MKKHLDNPVTCCNRILRVKPDKSRSSQSVEPSEENRDAALKEEKRPEMPVTALGAIHVHRPDGINTAGVFDSEMPVPKPRDTLVAAELVGIDSATTLDTPKEEARNSFARSVILSREQGSPRAALDKREEGFLAVCRSAPAPAPAAAPRLYLFLALSTQRNVGLVHLYLAFKLQ